MNKFIFYFPRVLSVIIVLFFGLFILEGLSPEFGWQASLMHLFQTLVILGATIIAWKWPKIGGWFFIIPGLYFLLLIFRNVQFFNLTIGSIFLITGILFLINKKQL
jgi:hypothetical protein